MLLRRSGEQTEESYQLAALTGAVEGEVGVGNENVLFALADAIFEENPDEIEAARKESLSDLGELATLDAIGVACAFNGITKIANATGIPLDNTTEETTVGMRQTTHIDDYSESHKSALFDGGA